MSQFFKDTILLLLLLLLLVVGGLYNRDMGSSAKFKDIHISIEYPDSIVLLTEEDVREELLSEKFVDMFTLMDRVDTDSVERYFASNHYVDSIEVYKCESGEVVIDIVQRSPICRLVAPDGDSYFYDQDGSRLPINLAHPCRVPIVTCDTTMIMSLLEVEESEKKYAKSDKKVAENYNFLDNLLNFVMFIRDDAFWSRQIVQINLSREGEVELVPRVGCHIVVLCDIEDLANGEVNLQKLGRFYRRAMSEEMWSTVTSVNLKYRDQVVCLR